jgi:acyl-CoA thioester hydrolase
MNNHTFEFRVAYADTDKMGVVYYANYFVLFERGRTELLREAGLRYRDLEDNLQVYLPVVDARCEYLAPARYDDLLRIRTTVAEVGRASLTFHYEVLDESGRVLVRGLTKHPFVNRDWKPVRVPETVRNVLQPGS